MFAALDDLATGSGFSGVVRVDGDGGQVFARAYGLAHRALGVPNTVDTQFAVASGVKGMTALTIMRLVQDGVLSLATPARALLAGDLPLIDDSVTVWHLLAHRSGIGDYLDESQGLSMTDYPMPVPVHRLLDTEDYLAVLDGYPMQFAPGERFRYCNGGFVVLALLAERATREPFHQLVDRCVVSPAGMTSTEFLRSDMLPASAALGYLDDGVPGWSNVHHLPVRGSGDGGVYTTVADMHRLWQAVFAGAVVAPEQWAQMISPTSSPATQSGSYDYGLGCWLQRPGSTVQWEGYDAGVSFRTWHDPDSGITVTVCSNTTEGAWPVLRELDHLLGRTPG